MTFAPGPIRAFSALLAAAVSLVGCGGDAGGTGAASSPPITVASFTPQPDVIAATPNPLMVSWTVDAARAVSASIGVLGGTLVATDADGTRFTLAIPGGALDDTVSITMTPITSFTGGRWKRAAGVQLLPDGQQFAGRVVLQVEPAFSVPIGRQVMLGFTGATRGEQFVAYADPASTVPRIWLDHFSARAFTDMDPADLAAAQASFPTDVLLRVENELGTAVAAERQHQLLDLPEAAPPNIADQWYTNIQKLWTEKLQSQIAAAASGDTCEGWQAVSVDANGALRQAEVLDLPVPDVSEFSAGGGIDFGGVPGSGEFVRSTVPFGGSIDKTLNFVCVRKASAACATQHDLTLVQTLQSVQRRIGFLGIDDADYDSRYFRMDERLSACLNYRIELDSKLDIGGLPGSSSVHTQVSGLVLQGFSNGTADAPLVTLANTSLQVDPPACGVVSDVLTGDGSLGATFGFDPAPPPARMKDARLEITPGNTAESWLVNGCDAGGKRYGPEAVWTGGFGSLNADKLQSGGFYRFEARQDALDGWELPPTGEVLMRKTFARTVGSITENSTVQVVHTPQAITENPEPPAGP